jgi:hypothetical protein
MAARRRDVETVAGSIVDEAVRRFFVVKHAGAGCFPESALNGRDAPDGSLQKP